MGCKIGKVDFDFFFTSWGKKFANEIQDLKQASVVGNKYKPRSHSASRINVRGNDYINALEDNDIKYFCQNTLTLASVKSSSPNQPKIFCIEKSNVIVLPSLRNQVGGEIADIKEIKSFSDNHSFNDNELDEKYAELVNDNYFDVDKSVLKRNLKDCTDNVETQKVLNETLNVIDIHDTGIQNNKNVLGRNYVSLSAKKL